jgi:hypothetical protein
VLDDEASEVRQRRRLEEETPRGGGWLAEAAPRRETEGYRVVWRYDAECAETTGVPVLCKTNRGKQTSVDSNRGHGLLRNHVDEEAQISWAALSQERARVT